MSFRPSRHSSRAPASPSRAIRWLAGFCAVTVWMLGLLAASPELHAALHADAGQADHDCVVTLFSHGTDTASSATPTVAAPVPYLVGVSPLPEVVLAGSVLDRLQPGRGPPVR
jgi:hypothetical protein